MRRTVKWSSFRLLILLSLGLGALASGETQRLIWPGTLPRDDWSWAHGVSVDGSVVVGWSRGPYGPRAFRWTAIGGMQNLGTLGGDFSEARGVSADGSVVVGWARDATEQPRAFRWTATGGMQDLGTLGGWGSWAYGVSADGSVVVGSTINPQGRTRAFRWTARSGMQDLGQLPGSFSSGGVAYAVSADGSVVVGQAHASPNRAFRWTSSSGMRDLWVLVGGYLYTEALGVSANGSVVIGIAYNNSGRPRAFRWQDGLTQDIGTLDGYRSEAYAVSADGSVVVGSSSGYAFRWTAHGGMEDLNQTYANLLSDGSFLRVAQAISPDGRYIVGEGYNAATGRWEAFLLDTGFPVGGDTNHDGQVDDADLLAVLFAFGARGYTNEDINWDGSIDDADLLEVLFNFGSGC